MGKVRKAIQARWSVILLEYYANLSSERREVLRQEFPGLHYYFKVMSTIDRNSDT